MARKTEKTPKVVGVPHSEVMAKAMKDPEFRYHYEQRQIVHEIALAVRGMRRQAGMTQVQLAKLVGVSQPMIARIEKGAGTAAPGWNTLRRVCIALGKQLRLSFVDQAEPGHLVEVDGKPAPQIEAEQAGLD